MYQHPGNRPIFLSLLKFRFPINAWLSAGHRLSGIALFISLLGYLALLNLILFNDMVTLSGIRDHWILLCLHSAFWISISFHWLTGLRHLLAEHFTQPKLYQLINSKLVSQTLLVLWLLLTLLILQEVWLS
ncbi:MAG: succinate dehydrogenase, cytochrome b556 subunit [Pseudomonadota bacterium]|nr:succinate dehydrogenase, cytochrome b556 subunit [Pseudomonadota bacterium]